LIPVAADTFISCTIPSYFNIYRPPALAQSQLRQPITPAAEHDLTISRLINVMQFCLNPTLLSSPLPH
jgi:hypothetical protein